MEVIESKEHLAGYLAIHHHKNNLAMMFTNPDKKVRLLLSFILFETHREMARLTQAIFYRSIISECHLQFQEIQQKHLADEIDGNEAVRLAELFGRKAELAHNRLMEITTNAQN